MDYKKLLSSEEYNFLKSDPRLGDNIILLGLGGSRAYGADIEGSDIDIRGIALNSPDEVGVFFIKMRRETAGFNRAEG